MSSASKAAEDLKNLANKLKPLFDVAEALDEIGSLENAASEAKARKDAAYKESDLAVEALAKLKNDIVKAKSEVGAATDNANQMLIDAKIAADLLLKTGKEKADAIQLKAQNKANALGAQVDALVQSFESIKKDLISAQNLDLAKKAALMKEIQKDIEEAQSRVKSLEV